MLSMEVSSTIFKVFGMDATWDWTQVSRTIGEYSNGPKNSRKETGEIDQRNNWENPTHITDEIT